MKYFIYQGNDHDCGFAALKMYLAILAKDKSYLYIPKPSKKEHYSLKDLANIALEYDVVLQAFGCTKDYYDSFKNPCLTLIDENHAVLVKKRNKNSVIIYDPGRGIIKMKKEEFLRRWRHVIAYTDEPSTIKKIEKKRQYLLPPKLDFISSFVSLFSAGLLIGAFYVLNNKENFLFSFLFLMLFVILQIAEKALLYKQVYTFDSNYIPLYFENKKNCSKEKYVKFVEFKRGFFTHNRQMISAILIAFMITFLLCFNDFRNVFVLLALILFKLLEIIIFSKHEDETRNCIAELENQDFKDPLVARDGALMANIKADKSIFYSSIKDLFYIFAAFIFAVVMMFLTNNVGCNFVIFHFVMYYAGFTSYNQLLSALSNRKENKITERRFFDACNL